MKRTFRPFAARSEAGFTVIELLITMTITVAIMVVVLAAVDMNANITRVQSDVSDLQQSTRIAQRDLQRMVRMVGRGGLPRALSVEVTQDASGLQVGGENVVDETDVVMVRGAFSSPVYRVDSSDTTTFQPAGASATLVIDGITKSAYEQSLGVLETLEDGGVVTPEAMLLVGAQGDAVFAVVEITDIQFSTVTLDIQNQTRTTDRATLTVSIDATAGGHAGDYLALSSTPGNFPATLTAVGFASLLEEHRFYVREDFSIPGDATSPPSPKLVRARLVPGTNDLHPEGAVDIADNVFDLQAALGVDLDGDGRVNIADPDGVPLATNLDEWLWNDVADDETDPAWDSSSLQHVRLTILGQVQTVDRQYISPAQDDVENHDYTEPAVPTTTDDIADRRYRRRLLQSTIDLRNL